MLWMPVLPFFEGFMLYEKLYDISLVIDYILMLLFTLPAALGALTLAHRMCRGEKAELPGYLMPTGTCPAPGRQP